MASRLNHPRREQFRVLVSRPEVTLAYVSGRDKQLVEQALKEYHLPQPHYALTDVGTQIYHIEQGQWHSWQSWEEQLSL